jgi:type I restriction enzyme S subunit
MKSNYKPIDNYIRLVDERNKGLKHTTLLGVSISKQFIPSVANIIGTDMENYKIIRKNQFACSTMQVRRDKKMPVALYLENEPSIISQAYPIFEIVNSEELLPEYLMMWFTRSEFDREACFNAVGGVRGSLEWEDFCNMQLPIPSIEKQKEIVKEYHILVNRIDLNNQLITKLEETAQAIYKQWFVDFEFPDEKGLPYKSNGGEMEFCEEFEKEIPVGGNIHKLSTYTKYSDKRIKINDLVPEKYISTENMLQNKKGIAVSDEIPILSSATKFVSKDILISNIRPYLKKIWFADFEGGCSNDVLCIETINQKHSYFIYNTLEQDSFFNYVMAGSKGTKMPRGDKQWIMDFKIAIPNVITLNKFSDFSEKNMNLKKSIEYENQKLEELKGLLLAKMTKVETEKELA